MDYEKAWNELKELLIDDMHYLENHPWGDKGERYARDKQFLENMNNIEKKNTP